MPTPSLPSVPHIVFLDAYTINPGDLTWDLLQAQGTLTTYDHTPASLVVERSKDADILIVNKVVLGEEQFSQLPHLRLVCEAATGFDKIDVEAARRHGITVCNCAGYSSRSVAQIVLSLLLEVADSVAEYTKLNHQGEWCKSTHFCYTVRPRFELVGKRMAIVGFGNIGRAVADVVRPLGVELFAVSSKRQEELPEDVRKITIEEAFATCHVVSLNCPLHKGNQGFVNARLLGNANPDLILINTARGGLVNEAELAEALRSQQIRAYCTDVLSVEPPTSDNPLLGCPNVFITPHIGWDTPEARSRILNIIINNIRAYRDGKPQNQVN